MHRLQRGQLGNNFISWEDEIFLIKFSFSFQTITCNLIRHLQRKHPEQHKEYEDAEKAKKDLVHQNLKRKRTSDPKQPKITDFTGTAVVMNTCVDLAVHRGIAFKTFDQPEMRNLTKYAKAGIEDKSPKVINAENVKAAISERAAKERLEVAEMLKGKVVSLMADFATCERRSFFGKLSLIRKKMNLTLTCF